MKKQTKETLLKLAEDYQCSIKAGVNQVMTSEERQEYLRTSEYGKAVGVSKKI